MKASVTKPAATPQTPVFKIGVHKPEANPKAATPSPKRDNIFSQSRDTREDRGTREMKTTHKSQTFPHGR
jgi:hypothetical protein